MPAEITLPRPAPCRHMGAATGEAGRCGSCPGNVSLKIFHCALYDRCTFHKKLGGLACCSTCGDYDPAGRVRWAYGVTTCPERRSNLLPKTLRSLKTAGFDSPHLFVDGSDDGASWSKEFGLDVTCRGGANVRVTANWMLSAWELYYRNPSADLYAIFQDDLAMCRGVREYVEKSQRPTDGYLNLFTFSLNEKVIQGKPPGWHEAAELSHEKGRQRPGGKWQQGGKGAVALVFPAECLKALLTAPHMVQKANSPQGWRGVDGGISESLNRAGWREYVHNPSLVSHRGMASTIMLHEIVDGGVRHVPKPPQRFECSFPGEGFDCKVLLSGGTKK